MDSSSDAASTYSTEKDLIKSLARYLNIDPQGTRAALVIFNGRPTVISDFESFSSASDFESAVDEAPHLGGDRSISEALQSAARMFTNSPASASKIIFLVTSGKPLNNEDGSSVADIVGRLSSMGVRTYVALVGTTPTGEEFRAMVEDPENVFAIESQGEIPKQINRVGSHVMTDSGKLHVFDNNSNSFLSRNCVLVSFVTLARSTKHSTKLPYFSFTPRYTELLETFYFNDSTSSSLGSHPQTFKSEPLLQQHKRQRRKAMRDNPNLNGNTLGFPSETHKIESLND